MTKLSMNTNLPRNITRKVRIRNELQVTLVVGGVVDDVHLAVIVHPELAHDDVVDGSGHLAPGVVKLVAARVDEKVGRAERDDLQVLATELGGHAELLLHFPTASRAVLGGYRRMVAHLRGKARHRTSHIESETIGFRFQILKKKKIKKKKLFLFSLATK
jgi:hypothetical protein